MTGDRLVQPIKTKPAPRTPQPRATADTAERRTALSLQREKPLAHERRFSRTQLQHTR